MNVCAIYACGKNFRRDPQPHRFLCLSWDAHAFYKKILAAEETSSVKAAAFFWASSLASFSCDSKRGQGAQKKSKWKSVDEMLPFTSQMKEKALKIS